MFCLRHGTWRKRLVTFSICIGFAAAIAAAADTAADAVFSKVRSVIAGDIAAARGVACMESAQRTRYAPRKPAGNATCADLIAAVSGAPQGAVEWRSRLRLSVRAGADAEEFGLTDASTFERTDVAGMLSAATAGSGEFSTFLRNLIAGDGDPFQPRGLQQTPLGQLLVFGFAVPAGKSHFKLALAGGGGPAGNTPPSLAYRGSLYAIPDSGDLKRLTLEAENVGDACRVEYATDYTSTRVADREIILPKSSTMDAIYKDGREFRSETYYSGCRRPGAAATAPGKVPPDKAVPKPMPPNVRLRVRFEPAIDSETAATGDPVTGVIRTTVKDKQSGIVVHAGDRLHGRIAAIEETLSPQPRWDLAIVFETIERGVGDHGIDQGVEQPVSVVWVDTANPGRGTDGGSFVFNAASFVLDQKFEMDWETR